MAQRAKRAIEGAAPTRARHVTLLFVVLLALITYMDRVAIAVAAPTSARTWACR